MLNPAGGQIQTRCALARPPVAHSMFLRHFTESEWHDLGALTECLEIVIDHDRLLRSMRFNDDDYAPVRPISILFECLTEQSVANEVPTYPQQDRRYAQQRHR
jgi:hypothetical protein